MSEQSAPKADSAPRIRGERLLQSLDDLAQLGAIEGGGVCRLALTDADELGRDWTVARMRALGMTVTIDAIGNGVAVYPGSEDLLPVMIGSHIDTVRTGGRYDGNYGVLAGLEVVATLRDAGLRPRRPIAVAFFTNEEGARFHPDMMGSLVYVGGMPLEDALATTGIDGVTVGAELRRIGYDGQAPVGKPRVDSFVELHIEQGPVLDLRGLQVGVVEGVQGISWTEFTIDGVSNHAGTTPMELRHDAGYAAARIANFVHDLALRYGGRQIATVGAMRFEPNLINVIPNRAVFTVDLRNTDERRLAQAETEVLAFAQQTCETETLSLSHRRLARFEPVAFDPMVIDLVEQEAAALGFTHMRMPSGAGHDAQMLARVCPAGMIFVPSVKGLSHNVREFTEPDDLIDGAQILLQVVLKLANRP
ncbi:Zn-dependent hydrolase [Cupriavidus sp. UME77]|uniref:Zn-dependent hydrolase n=1 Tax=Cupriavidus sp. UME77 TaxID=1862321 RepID=UPI0016016676|nr:Zn-dependent hydrolase [Cupriavidus sp. UME77]MBB1634440.1 Zn-dependent hydrolase [Cupriavidus sp. UME77]